MTTKLLHMLIGDTCKHCPYIEYVEYYQGSNCWSWECQHPGLEDNKTIQNDSVITHLATPIPSWCLLPEWNYND